MSTAQLIAVALLVALSAAMLAALLGRSSRGGGMRTVSGRPLPAPRTSMPPPIVLPKSNPAHLFELLVEKSARIEELERQRDAVLALCDEADRIPVYDRLGEAFPGVSAVEIRAIYGGGQ